MAKKKDEFEADGVEEAEALDEDDELLLDAVWDRINSGKATSPGRARNSVSLW
jgi:hypothetical protein